MVREIEFRAWLKNIEKMVEVEEINFTHKEVRFKDYETPFTKPIEVNVSFEDIELIQYTGLKDKNKVKIFEGDIVNYYGRNAIVKIGFPHDEKWYPYGVCIEYIKYNLKEVEYVYKLDLENLEVIGNVWENKELLENA